MSRQHKSIYEIVHSIAFDYCTAASYSIAVFFFYCCEQWSDISSLGYNEATTAGHTHGVFQLTVDKTIY